MSSLETMLKAAPSPVDGEWFANLANVLLNQIEFVVGGQSHRLLEIEFYYSGGDHFDPFAHCDPIQKSSGLWYFHRDNEGYRGGSFKGLDISFGPEDSFGGILIRTIEGPDGSIINGCSLCVDHMLSLTNQKDPRSLDNAVEGRSVWDVTSPLFLRFAETDNKPIYSTARVGLTLKRLFQNPTMPEYIMSDYRFLTEPTIKKGKIHTVMSLIKQGLPVDEIRAITKSPANSIRKYKEGFEAGQALENFNSFRGKALKVDDLCQLHGIYHRMYGQQR